MQKVKITDIRVSKDRQRQKIEDIDKLMESINEFGILEPILLSDTGDLIAGFRRFTAASLLGHTEVPAIYLGELSDLDRQRIELEENVQRQQLTWAEEARAIARINELRREEDPNWTAEQTGEVVGKSRRAVYNSLELAEALESDPDLADAKTLVGALQRLKQKKQMAARKARLEAKKKGRLPSVSAKIKVGDALKLIKKLPDESVDTIITNPPFGINLEYKDHPEVYEDDPEKVKTLVQAMVPEWHRILAPDSWCVVFWDVLKLDILAEWLTEAGFEVNAVPAIWVKPNKTQGGIRDPWGHFIVAYEAFLFARKGNAQLTRAGRQNIFIYDTPEEGERIHPVQMSAELCTELVSLTTIGGELVHDSFAGSGAIGLGALENQCAFIGFELNKEYAEGGNLRLQEHMYAKSAEESGE